MLQEKVKAKLKKAKEHIVENREVYISGIVCFTVGVAVSQFISTTTNTPQVVGGSASNDNDVQVGGDVNAPITINQNATVVNNFGGRLCKIVKCVDTGEIFETAKAAAKSAGVDPVTMSKHLNGKRDHLFGMTYEVVGIGTT